LVSLSPSSCRLASPSPCLDIFLPMVPGAGLEPARTLPGPRDFSPTISLSTNIHRNLKRGLQGDSRYGVCVCLLLNLTRLATAMGTTRAAHFLRLFVNQWKRDHRKPPIKAHAKAETTKTPMEQERTILNSVHGIEDGQAEVSLNTCENPLCRTKYQPTCLPWVKQRYCSDPCRQQMSIIRRAAKLFEPVPRLRVPEILRGG
jgi:hypothetical protein